MCMKVIGKKAECKGEAFSNTMMVSFLKDHSKQTSLLMKVMSLEIHK